MKELFLYKIVPLVIIGIFILIMTTGTLLKQPLSKEDDVIYYINIVNENVKSEKWEEASENIKRAKNAYKKVVKRIQYSVERNEVNLFSTSIERASGYITAHEKAGAMAELQEARFLWNDLGK